MNRQETASTMHVAELNIVHRRFAFDDPRFADFINNLERINALAERAPGFVWRLKDDSGTSIHIETGDDPTLLPNLSLWETIEDLHRFTFQTVHARIYDRRHEWFDPHQQAHFVMWHVPVGHRPSLEEAFAQLETLRRHGSSDRVFGWETLQRQSESSSHP